LQCVAVRLQCGDTSVDYMCCKVVRLGCCSALCVLHAKRCSALQCVAVCCSSVVAETQIAKATHNCCSCYNALWYVVAHWVLLWEARKQCM